MAINLCTDHQKIILIILSSFMEHLIYGAYNNIACAEYNNNYKKKFSPKMITMILIREDLPVQLLC